MSAPVCIATVNVHAYAALGQPRQLAAVMRELARFPGVYIATDDNEPGVLFYEVVPPPAATDQPPPPPTERQAT